MELDHDKPIQIWDGKRFSVPVLLSDLLMISASQKVMAELHMLTRFSK